MSEKRTGSLFLNGRRAGRQIAGRAKRGCPDAREGEDGKGQVAEGERNPDVKNRRSCRVLFGSGVAGVYGYIEGCA